MAQNETALPLTSSGEWQPERTGDYGEDCRAGRELAKQMLVTIASSNNPTLFGTIVRAITAGGRFEAVEIGFCSQVGIFVAVNA